MDKDLNIEESMESLGRLKKDISSLIEKHTEYCEDEISEIEGKLYNLKNKFALSVNSEYLFDILSEIKSAKDYTFKSNIALHTALYFLKIFEALNYQITEESLEVMIKSIKKENKNG